LDDLFVTVGTVAMVVKVGVTWGGAYIQYQAMPPPMWAFYAMAALTATEV
jgi:hypothetical protein